MTEHLNRIQQDCTNLSSDAELVVGEIYGLRQWSLREAQNGLSLFGHRDFSWDLVDPNVAECTLDYRTVRRTLAVATRAMGYARMHLEFETQRMLREHPEASVIVVTLEGAQRSMSITRDRDFPRIFPWDIITAGRHATSVDGVLTFEEGLVFTLKAWIPLEPHTVTDPSCTCGFYAYSSRKSLLENSSAGMYKLFGLIKAYGYVTQGTKGFRAQKAEIVGLTHPASHSFRPKRQEFEKIIPDNVVLYKDFADLVTAARPLVNPENDPW